MITAQLSQTAATVEQATSRQKVMEPKLDGVRLLARIEGEGRVTFYTRGGHAHSGRKFPLIREDLAVLPEGTWLDGELWSPYGFGKAQGALATVDEAEAARKAEDAELIFYVFDLLTLEGNDTRGLPFEQRRSYLERVGAKYEWGEGGVRVIPQHEATAETYQAYLDAGFEGAMVKALDAPYRSGQKGAWWKVKPVLTDEYVVMRTEEGDNSWRGRPGKLVFGETEDGPEVGKVRVKDEAMMLEIEADPDAVKGRFVEIIFQEVTDDGRLRFPRFFRWRDDKTADARGAGPAKEVARV